MMVQKKYIISELGCSCFTTYVAFANNLEPLINMCYKGYKRGTMPTGYKAKRVVLLACVIRIYLGGSCQAAWEK
jgi:hypothetical protein